MACPVFQRKLSLMLDIACDPSSTLSLVSLPSPVLIQGIQGTPHSCAPHPPTPTQLFCLPGSPAHPTAGRPSRRAPSSSGLLLSQQTPEPTGLSLRTEESDLGSKSQDSHTQYSPILKKEQPAAPTQKEGGGEPKEVSCWKGPARRRGAWGRGVQGALGLVPVTHRPPASLLS